MPDSPRRVDAAKTLPLDPPCQSSAANALPATVVKAVSEGEDRRTRLRAEQARRWQQGERVRAEDLLAGEDGLADDPDAVLDLVRAEVLLRRQQGESPEAEEYAGRFPAHAEVLRRHLGGDRVEPEEAPCPTSMFGTLNAP